MKTGFLFETELVSPLRDYKESNFKAIIYRKSLRFISNCYCFSLTDNNSTLGALLLLVCIIMVIIEMWPRGRYYDDKPTGLISEDRVENLNQENLRKQILSYGTRWLIDTLKSEYIIPVSIKTLKKPEEVVQRPDGGLMALMDVY